MSIDLGTMRRRAQSAADPCWTGFWAGAFADDVTNLIAEVDRLRRVVEELRDKYRGTAIRDMADSGSYGSLWVSASEAASAMYDAETKRLVEGE